ncbi:MAG: hypothetical protein JSU04_04010 [Bdellovibrionales bacterium]|nr:hypothetical protein [Bdellovibrionales bacterium]
MKTPLALFILFLSICPHSVSFAQSKQGAANSSLEVEWYPPETEKGRTPDRARVVVSGRTTANSRIQVDGESVTIMNKVTGASNAKIDSRETRSNFEGFFEVALELPQGLAQIPIQITTGDRTQKTFMISVDVKIVKNNIDEVRINNTKISRNKPPAAAKRFRLWAGAGWTYQSYNQSTTGSPDLQFSTVQAPGVVLRGGYWGEKFGLDLYFRDAPGKITADPPLTVKTDSYHWRTLEAKGLYQFDRGPGSRMMGLPSQWQLRFGAQKHQVPYLNINASNEISVSDVDITTATLGIGLLLGQEQSWSYEFALGLQQPMSASAADGDFTLSSKMAYEVQIGAAYKFAPNWRLGVFSYTQSLDYTYDYKPTSSTTKSGQQKLFYTTFDLRLGYEF